MKGRLSAGGLRQAPYGVWKGRRKILAQVPVRQRRATATTTTTAALPASWGASETTPAGGKTRWPKILRADATRQHDDERQRTMRRRRGAGDVLCNQGEASEAEIKLRFQRH